MKTLAALLALAAAATAQGAQQLKDALARFVERVPFDKGMVTIATNMAGRGTDILLGGNPEFMAKQECVKKGIAQPLRAAQGKIQIDVDETKSTVWYYAGNEYQAGDYKLIDFVHKLHYEKLQDSAGNCLCTKLTDQQIADLGAGKPQIIKIKFPAPPADVTSLTVELPHAEPIDEVPLTQAASSTAAGKGCSGARR